MNLLRYVLVVGTLAVLGFFLYVGYTIRRHWDFDEALWWWLCVIVAGLNVVYLLSCPPGIPKSPSRLRKLVSLWLDAKERELRDRAGKS